MSQPNGGKYDHLDRAYARLTGIRNNVPAPPEWLVGRALVEQYHDALNHLAAAGFGDLREFMIPTYYIDSEDGAVRRDLFLAQVDSVIGYFQLRRAREKADETGEAPWLIVEGFKPPARASESER